MTEVATTTPARAGWARLSRRGLFVLISSAALGISYGIIEQDWHSGAWAAISLWIVLGLMAQVHDLWRSPEGSDALTPEERWGWRFAVAWRVAIACLMVAYFVVRLLVTSKVLALNDGSDITYVPVSSRTMLDAVLFTSMIVAIASAPRFDRKGERRSWSWAIGLLGYVATALLCVFLLMSHFVVAVLVLITIVGIQAAWPLKFVPDFLATYGPAKVAWFFDVTTVGVVSVVVSCGLLRVLSIYWWRGTRQRIYLGILLAASLTIMILLAGRIALVEVPEIAPILVANTPMPTSHRLAIAAVLVLILVCAAARRWSEPLPVGSAAGSEPWHRDELKYYHERRIPLFLLAGVMLAQLVGTSLDSYRAWGPTASYLGWMSWPCAFDWIMTPLGCLSLAVIFLAVQSIFFRKSKCVGVAPIYRPRLAPGLFLLTWSVLLAIVVFGVPILAAWGFALWFNLP
jgi:hypothetical protein